MFVPSRSPAPPRPTARLVLALLLVLCAGAAGGAGGCGSARDGAAKAPGTPTNAVDPAPTPTPGDSTLLTKTGTVRWLDLEGGFWGIVGDDSTHYDPGTLDERFQHDGMRVRFDARVNESQMSTRQWGRLVTLVRIDPR